MQIVAKIMDVQFISFSTSNAGKHLLYSWINPCTAMGRHSWPLVQNAHGAAAHFMPSKIVRHADTYFWSLSIIKDSLGCWHPFLIEELGSTKALPSIVYAKCRLWHIFKTTTEVNTELRKQHQNTIQCSRMMQYSVPWGYDVTFCRPVELFIYFFSTGSGSLGTKNWGNISTTSVMLADESFLQQSGNYFLISLLWTIVFGFFSWALNNKLPECATNLSCLLMKHPSVL